MKNYKYRLIYSKSNNRKGNGLTWNQIKNGNLRIKNLKINNSTIQISNNFIF